MVDGIPDVQQERTIVQILEPLFVEQLYAKTPSPTAETRDPLRGSKRCDCCAQSEAAITVWVMAAVRIAV